MDREAEEYLRGIITWVRESRRRRVSWPLKGRRRANRKSPSSQGFASSLHSRTRSRSIRRFSAICSRVTAGSATKIAIGTLLGVWPPIHRLRTIRHDLVQTVRRPIFRAWIACFQYRLFRIGFSSPDACLLQVKNWTQKFLDVARTHTPEERAEASERRPA